MPATQIQSVPKPGLPQVFRYSNRGCLICVTMSSFRWNETNTMENISTDFPWVEMLTSSWEIISSTRAKAHKAGTARSHNEDIPLSTLRVAVS